PDREIRRAIADDVGADEIFEPLLRAPDVGPELLGRQARHALVPIAVAGDLVALRGNPAHQRRVLRGDFPEREERSLRPGPEQGEQDVDARLDPALESPGPGAASAVPENLGVKIFLD